MKCSECKMLFVAAVITLLAVTAFCVIGGSDDSYADSSGRVLGPDSSEVGSYSLDGFTLTLEASSVSPVTSVTLENFTEKNSVQKIVIRDFVNNITASFVGYENLDTIEYQGPVSTGGSWTFDFYTGTINLTASNIDSSVDYIELSRFNMKSLVTSVLIKGYTKNLSSSFSDYSSLNNNITYSGTFTGTFGGLWEYSLKTKTLTVDRPQSSSSDRPGDYTAGTAPFQFMFFKDEAEIAIYKTYTGNSSYLFYGLTAIKSFRATDYLQYNNYEILYGMNETLEELRYDSINRVEKKTVEYVKYTLKTFTADNATQVASNSFLEAGQLATVSIPRATSIGEFTFTKCSSLAIVDLNGCTSIGRYAFNECTSLRDISLPSATTINEYTFNGCTSLRTATLASATSIGSYCFKGCGNLNTVTFGSQVAIGDSAFAGCSNLSNITASNINTIGYNAFNGCSALNGEGGTLTFTYLTLIHSDSSRYPFKGCTSISRVVLPAISTMEPYAFYNLENLTSVTIGNHLGELPDYAFAGCNHLNSLTLGDDLIEIGQYAFSGCTALESVELPDSLETIKGSAFRNSGITALDTNNVTTIGANAFQDSNITLLTLGTSIATIGSNAFYSSAISGTLTFPTSIRSIGDGAFYNTQMEAVTFLDTSTATTYTIGNNSFQGCSKLVTVVLGARLDSVGTEAFFGCPMLVNMTYGSNLTSIGDRAFQGCNSLSAELVIPSKTIYIGSDAFKGTAIRGLEFADNSKLTSISDGAFQDCRSLRRTIDFPNSIQTIGKNVFNNSTIRGITFNVTDSKLTTIGENAFRGCSSLAGDIILPLNVTTIGTYAFYGCGITGLSLGANVQNLGAYAFANNAGLTSIVIPNTVNGLALSERLFSGCMLTDIYISSTVTSIGVNAFYCVGVTASEINLWFNGSMTGLTLSNNAFVFNNTAILNVYADAASADIASALKTAGKASGVAGVTYIQRDLAVVGFRITNSTPMYTSATALYGSKIILPYYRAGETYGVVCYSVADNTPTYLAVFASEDDYENDRIARSGDVVSVFPYMDGDRVSMQGSSDTSGFVKDMVIQTDSGGLDVNILSQTVHYGGSIIVPQFIQSDIIQISSIDLQLSDGTGSYQFPVDTVSIYAGFHFATIVLGHEDVMIDVLFIRQFGNETPQQQVVQVKLREPFYVPDAVLWMTEAPAGYEYYDWWDAPMNIEGTGGVKAIEGTTPFDFNEEWYVHYKPLNYTLTLTNTAGTPAYSGSWTMTGPYQLHIVGKSLYYTDAKQTENRLLFDENSVPGWSVSDYEDNSGREITGDSAIMTSSNGIFLRMQMNEYDITLRFYTNGAELPSSEIFIINGWAIGEGTEYHSGSVIEGVSYSFIENGLDMPVPINQTRAFNNMVAGEEQIPNQDGKYTLTLAYFGNQTSITIKYNMDEGVYTVQFVMNDDKSTVATDEHPYHIGDSLFLRSSDYFTKVGYQFTYYSIPGSGVWADRQTIEITPDMATKATYCVITVTANWTPIHYTVSFDLSPYEGTVPSQTVINGDTITLPDVSGNHGYVAASWYWFKDATKSEPFTGSTELTSDVITTYADGLNLTIGVNWELRAYKANVSGYPSYGEITNLKLGDTITLWSDPVEKPYKKFAGWSTGSELYSIGDHEFDLNMAVAGDANNFIVSFEMTYYDIEYHVQYNGSGSPTDPPEDPNAYIIGDDFEVAPVDESTFYKYGYSFVGWSLDGTTIFYGSEFNTTLAETADSNNTVIFYAVWAQKSYKINYELEGGRYGTSAPTNVRYGDPVTIDNPTRVGYRFEGWTAVGLTSGALYLSKTGYFMSWNGSMVDSTVYKDLTDKSTDKVIATVTLTAHWAEASYTTEYLPNGGTWTSITSSQYQISIGDVIELPSVRDAKKTGYTFAGWGIDTINTIPSGTRLTEAMISDPNKFTLYAIWTPVVYQLQYRYTDDYQYSTVNVDYGSSAYVPILDRAGYTFRGWTITGAGLEAEYSRDNVEWYKLGSSLIDGTYFRNMSSEAGGIVTMDAEWNSIEYRLSYNTNGGTGKAPVDSNSYKVGDPVVMKDYKDLIGTNGSKVIIGWSLEINGSAVNVNEFTQGLCTMADATNTVNFYGVWVNDMCTVVVDLEGCSASSIPAGWVKNADGTYEKLVNYGTETKDALADWDDVVLSKDGYNFAGWDYDTSTVMSTVTAYPTFDKVNMSIMYVFGGIIGVFVVAAIVFARR